MQFVYVEFEGYWIIDVYEFECIVFVFCFDIDLQ